MIITISGNIASGKSTAGAALAKKLGFKHYSTGEFMRTIAKEKGISMHELAKIAEESNEIDKILDEWTIDLGKTKDNFIIDCRLGWYFIPKSFKIYLFVSKDDQLRRIKLDLSKKRRGEEYLKDREQTDKEILDKVKEREDSEAKRYMKYYNIDYRKKELYDLWLNTDGMTIDGCAEEIKRILKEKGLA
ncbi:MAG: cytidylate kinase family protein [Candidatus Woesearchaeota archaeon]